MRVRTLECDGVGVVGLHRNRDGGIGVNAGYGVDTIGTGDRTTADSDTAHGIAINSRDSRDTSCALLDFGRSNKLNVLAHVVGSDFLAIERNLGRNVVRIHDLGVVEIDRLAIFEDNAAELILGSLNEGLAVARLANIVDNRIAYLNVGAVVDVALLITVREIALRKVGRIASRDSGIIRRNHIAGHIELDDFSGNVFDCTIGGNINLRYIRAKAVHAVGNDVARIPRVRFRCSLVLPPVCGR